MTSEFSDKQVEAIRLLATGARLEVERGLRPSASRINRWRRAVLLAVGGLAVGSVAAGTAVFLTAVILNLVFHYSPQ